MARAENKSKSWTKEEDITLLWYHQNGKSHEYMAKKLGRTKGGVSGRIGTLRAAETIDPVEEKLEWTAERNAYLTQLVEEGKSYEEIGALMGRTPKAVDVHVYRLRKRGDLPPALYDRRRSYTPQGDLFTPVVTAEPVVTEPVREVPNTKPKPKP
jgi:transcriptional regulator